MKTSTKLLLIIGAIGLAKWEHDKWKIGKGDKKNGR